ncbi:hypothetical protein DL93DRAFT_1927416 [Clavulina sp. PMI_390]|nr:hypothetical protein DL93DRAFT_1927416 [Clavulina sp. PMI_390]
MGFRVEPTSRNSHNMPTPSPQRQPLFRSTPDPSEGVQLADANTDWVLPRLSPLSNDVMDMAPPPLKSRGTRATLSASQRPKNTSRNTDPPESQQTIVPGLSPSPRRQQLEDIIFPSTASTAVTLVEPLADPLTGELTFEEKRALLKSHKFIPSTPEPVRVPPSSSPFVTAFRANRAPRRSLLSQATPRSTGTLVAESSTPRLTLNAASPPTVFRAGSQLRPPGSARSSLAPALSQAVAEAMPVEDQIELEALCEEFGFTFEEALKEYVLQEGNVRKTLISLDNKLAYAEILSEPLRDPSPRYEGHEYDAAERQAEQELQQEAMSVEADSEAEELVDSLVTPRKRKMRAASVSSGSSISSAVTREGSHSSLDVEDILGVKAETQSQETVPSKAAAVPADEGEEDSEDETAPRPTRTAASRRQRRLDLPYPKFAPRGSQAHEAAAKLWKDAQRDLEQPRYQTRSRSRKNGDRV